VQFQVLPFPSGFPATIKERRSRRGNSDIPQ
jgi:hypothetical protein